jgi:hypothetical protein
MTKRLLFSSTFFTEAKAINVLPMEQMFFKEYGAGWPFQGELSSNHAMLSAAAYIVRELS